MKITTTYLRQVIKEEINQVLYEQEAEETVQGFLDILNKEIKKRPEVEKEIEENKKLAEGSNPWKDPKSGKVFDIRPALVLEGDFIAREVARGRAQALRTGEHKKQMAMFGGGVGLTAGMGASVLAFTAAAIAGMSNPELAMFLQNLQDQGIITLGAGGFALAASAPMALTTIIGALKGYFKGKKEEEAFNKELDDALQNKP